MCSRDWWRNRCMFLDFAFLLTLFQHICHEINNHVSMMILQMRWNNFYYHTFKFSYEFRLIWLSDQTSFCKIKTCRWNFIAHENFKIEVSQASIVNMTYAFNCFFSQIIFFFLTLFLDAYLSFGNGFQQLYVFLCQTWLIEFISCSLS